MGYRAQPLFSVLCKIGLYYIIQYCIVLYYIIIYYIILYYIILYYIILYYIILYYIILYYIILYYIILYYIISYYIILYYTTLYYIILYHGNPFSGTEGTTYLWGSGCQVGGKLRALSSRQSFLHCLPSKPNGILQLQVLIVKPCILSYTDK